MADDHDRASGPVAPGADTLSDVLEAVRLTGALFFLVDASTPWVASAPSSDLLAPAILPRARHVVSYHVVRNGCCWCEVPGEPPVRLEPGDAVVIPRGDTYVLSSPSGTTSEVSEADGLLWFREMAAGRLPAVVTEGGGGPESLQVVCGFLACDALPFNPVFTALPRVLPVRRVRNAANDRLESLIDFAAAESQSPSAGSRSVLLRIGELMFVEVMRRSLADQQGGWLAGLADPLVGRALAALHQRPAEPWTLAALARELGTSRSVLVERFTHFVGQPPMHYLARWRIERAAAMLQEDGTKVAAIGREVGYESEAAFSRAFKRLTGASPSRWRRRDL